jgi:hypothetical protein
MRLCFVCLCARVGATCCHEALAWLRRAADVPPHSSPPCLSLPAWNPFNLYPIKSVSRWILLPTFGLGSLSVPQSHNLLVLPCCFLPASACDPVGCGFWLVLACGWVLSADCWPAACGLCSNTQPARAKQCLAACRSRTATLVHLFAYVVQLFICLHMLDM